jgi:hypothetical protein
VTDPGNLETPNEAYLFFNTNPELGTFHDSEEVQFLVYEWSLEMQRPDFYLGEICKLFLVWANTSMFWGDCIKN